MNSTIPLLMMAAVAAGFTLWPLLSPAVRRLRVSREDTALGRLHASKQTLLENLADLDFEHAMGKLATDDHQVLRASVEQQAASVLAQIDALEGARGALPVESDGARFCHQCGAGLPERARFCPSCGEQVSA